MLSLEDGYHAVRKPRHHTERPHLGVLIPETSEVLAPTPYLGKPDLLIPASSVKDS